MVLEILKWLIAIVSISIDFLYYMVYVYGFHCGDPLFSLPDVRLVGDASDRSGRVEVFVDSAWLGVRKERWTSREANVLCHQLG